MYSSGMPLLYLVGFISFLLSYWVDKMLCNSNYLISFLVLRIYRKPPRYDSALSFEVRDIIKYALIIHFAFGFYMYSNSSIFHYSAASFSFLSSIERVIDEST